MTIDLEGIKCQLPPGFNVQIDGDVITFGTTHEGKNFGATVDVSEMRPDFVPFALESAIHACHRFYAQGPQ